MSEKTKRDNTLSRFKEETALMLSKKYKHFDEKYLDVWALDDFITESYDMMEGSKGAFKWFNWYKWLQFMIEDADYKYYHLDEYDNFVEDEPREDDADYKITFNKDNGDEIVKVCMGGYGGYYVYHYKGDYEEIESDSE